MDCCNPCTPARWKEFEGAVLVVDCLIGRVPVIILRVHEEKKQVSVCVEPPYGNIHHWYTAILDISDDGLCPKFYKENRGERVWRWFKWFLGPSKKTL